MNTQVPSSILSVFELNRSVRRLFEGHYGYVWVEGEVSNFSRPSSGHWYFTLKDEKAQVRCAMFRNRNIRIRQIPDNGEKIRLRGKVSLYEGRGEYQLIAEHIESSGFGVHQVAFEKLKQKLAEEGLFSQGCKKPIPPNVKAIGLITSLNGAVIQDVLKTLKRRCPSLEIYVLPVTVQGSSAIIEISNAIEKIAQWKKQDSIGLDVIILARGGGSLEDLSVFNDENLARTIFNCNIPIISAIGHEVDITIADLVSDLRAATPTAAAELVSPDQSIWEKTLKRNALLLEKSIASRILVTKSKAEYLKKRLRHPKLQLQDQSQKTDHLEQILIKTIKNKIELEKFRLANSRRKLLTISPINQATLLNSLFNSNKTLLIKALKRRFTLIETQLSHKVKILDAINPNKVFDRGYALLTTNNGTTIKNRSEVKSGTPLVARMALGRLHVTASRWEDQAEE